MSTMDSDRFDHVTVADEDAYSVLVARNLPVLRVEQSLPNGGRAIIWRNEPTDSERSAAEALMNGTAPSHGW